MSGDDRKDVPVPNPGRGSGFGVEKLDSACAVRCHLRACSRADSALCPSSTAAKERLIMQHAGLLPLAVCSFISAGG